MEPANSLVIDGKKLRERFNKTIKATASDLGVSRTHLQLIVSNKKNPSLKLATKICRHLGVDLREIAA